MAEKLEQYYFEHRLNLRLAVAEANSSSKDMVHSKVNRIDRESNRYMRCLEKKCQKLKSGCILFLISLWCGSYCCGSYNTKKGTGATCNVVHSGVA